MGKEPNGFQQQQSYPEKLSEILGVLKQEVDRRGDIDFILHGGDMIHTTSDEDILATSKLFDWGMPVYLCLGNHDLTTPDAMERWMKLAPQFFKGGLPEYSIESPDCTIHVVPNHWGDETYYWKESQSARFSKDQMKTLSQKLSQRPNLPHFLSTHSPAFGFPVEQSGLKEPIHVPEISFTESITSMAARHPNLRCVMGAHSHLNMRVQHQYVEFITVSSLIEAPFEFKLVEVSEGTIRMTTCRLGPECSFNYRYDDKRSFVQGREEDRGFRGSW